MPRLQIRPSARFAQVARCALLAACCAAVPAAAVAGGSFAAAFEAPPTVGDAAPAIPALPAADGTTKSLADFADDKVVAVVFTCNHCPIAKAYEGRLNAFVADYEDKPVGFLAVSVSNAPDDDLAAMKTYAREQGLKFPYVHDASQQVGKAYGATVTPHAFVLGPGPDRKVVYVGLWDDSIQDPAKVKKTYARDAVDAVLAGEPVPVATTRPLGCGIRYDD